MGRWAAEQLLIDRGSLVLTAGVVVASAGWTVAYLLADQRATVGALALMTPAVLAGAGAAGRWAHRATVSLPALIPPTAGLMVFVATAGVDLALAAMLGLALLLWAPWSLGRWLRARAELVAAGWDTAALWEERAGDIERDARARERERLAAHMHDLVGHDLARAALALGAIELNPDLPPDLSDAVSRARTHVSTAAERLADAITTDAGTNDSTTAPAEQLLELVTGTRDDGRDVVFVPAEPSSLLSDLAPQIVDLLVRVVREGLTNAVKHTERAPIEVSLARRATTVAVVVRTRDAVLSAAPAAGSGRGLHTLGEDVAASGGAAEHGLVGRDHLLTVRLPLVPHPTDDGLTGVVGAHRAAAQHVQHSRALAVRGTATVIGVSLLLGVAYRVVDVTTSVLPTDTFEAVQIADPRTAVAERLPWRTRTDATGITPPPGTRCEHYSASTDLLSADLYRLCWADGRLSSKDLIRRPAAAPGTIGT